MNWRRTWWANFVLTGNGRVLCPGPAWPAVITWIYFIFWFGVQRISVSAYCTVLVLYSIVLSNYQCTALCVGCKYWSRFRSHVNSYSVMSNTGDSVVKIKKACKSVQKWAILVVACCLMSEICWQCQPNRWTGETLLSNSFISRYPVIVDSDRYFDIYLHVLDL